MADGGEWRGEWPGNLNEIKATGSVNTITAVRYSCSLAVQLLLRNFHFDFAETKTAKTDLQHARPKLTAAQGRAGQGRRWAA